jgi:hypothetical protein
MRLGEGKLSEALPLLRRAANANRDHRVANYLLGTTLLRAQKPRETVAALQQAVHLKPNHVEAYAPLWQALLKLNQPASDLARPQFGFGWAFSFGGPPVEPREKKITGNDQGKSIAVDGAGNVFVAGFVDSQTVNFDPGGQPSQIESGNILDLAAKIRRGGDPAQPQLIGNILAFAAKYRPDRTLVWARVLGPGEEARIAVRGAAVWVLYQHTVGRSRSVSASVAKLNGADGNPIWMRTFTNDARLRMDIAIGVSGSAYITGTATSEAYVTKLDASGNNVWTQTTSGGTARGLGIAINATEQILVTGEYSGEVKFGQGTTLRVSDSRGAPYVWKLKASGETIWAGPIGNSGPPVQHRAIAVDADGNAYIATAIGGMESWLVKLRSAADGTLKQSWIKRVGGDFRGLAVDPGGSVYMTGSFYRSANFDPDGGEFVLSAVRSATLPSGGSALGRDIFVSKIDTNGSLVTAASASGAGFVGAGWGITVDGSGDVYFTGGFRLTANFHPGDGNHNLTAQGLEPAMDVFVAKWTRPSLPQVEGAAKAADPQRLRLLEITLNGLAADIATWATLADRPQKRARLRQTLQRWQTDPDLASVREEAALAKLPESERLAWKKLWAEVGATLAKSKDASTTTEKPEKKP